MALILASGSPRRRELMSLITPDYTVITSDVDETKIAADSPAHLAKALATAKARAVAEENPDDVVCGFDTVVECEGEVFGKPKDEADAVRMLRTLSGREHRVHTGVCICRGRRAAATVETTVVHFSPIAEDDLCAYVRTPEPYDKAGAYAIQGHAALWCAGIEGCYYNIMGLPVHRTAVHQHRQRHILHHVQHRDEVIKLIDQTYFSATKNRQFFVISLIYILTGSVVRPNSLSTVAKAASASSSAASSLAVGTESPMSKSSAVGACS